jgi:hypothetical protein
MKKLILLILIFSLISIISGCTQSAKNSPKVFKDDFMPTEVQGIDPSDINGDTPDIIVEQYFEYRTKENWDSLFNLHATTNSPVTVEEFSTMFNEDNEKVLEFTVYDFIITGEAEAAVKVEYLVENYKEKMLFIEWWRCLKEEGIWKLAWVQRQ